jgi:cell volume regulation protein A
LLLVFLLVGMLAGEGGPGGLKFNDVGTAYTVGSIALALILFDGGLRTRFATIRSVLAPSVMLATVGVIITTLLLAPVAKFVLGIGWIEALLMGAVVASTDAAAVFLLINAGGLRLRPRVRSTLEVESGTNDPFAVFLALLLVEILSVGGQSWSHVFVTLFRDVALGCVIGYGGGRIITLVLNRVSLAQGLHAPFVAVSALVVFAFANSLHSSGFLAVYLAGLVVGNRQTRAHNSVVVFLDAVTWLAQIVMFVLLGLLVWPDRLADSLVGAVIVALMLMLVARPVAVFLCLWPFTYQWREKLFISWVGLRGAVAIFLASIPLLVGLPGAYLYFDVAFVVVLTSLLIQGWTVALSARKLDMSFARSDPLPRRVELDLPGQMAREMVGYPVPANSPFLKRGLIPNWARPTLVIRDEDILTPVEAEPVREGDYVYLLAPPEKAQALDRFFMNMPPPREPDPELLGDFFVAGTASLGALADIYGLQVAADHTEVTLADYFTENLGRAAKTGDIVALGPIALLAHKVEDGKVTTVGLRLAEPETAATLPGRAKALVKRLQKWIG